MCCAWRSGSRLQRDGKRVRCFVVRVGFAGSAGHGVELVY